MNIVDKKKLFEAKRVLNALLERCPPELREYQKHIDRELEKAGKNLNDRMVVLLKMIHDNQMTLVGALEELNGRLIHQRDDLLAISRKGTPGVVGLRSTGKESPGKKSLTSRTSLE